MRTILVTGSDTGIGKTRVSAAIARLLWKPDLKVQFVKPVETGREPGETGDADTAADESGIATAETFTLVRLRLPLAPLATAHEDAHPLTDAESGLLSSLLGQWTDLPPADLRIVEGAGGIAVPLDRDGSDWASFAHAIHADRVVLVTPDRLGGINQARLVTAYAKARNLHAGLWLNELQPQPDDVRLSNREGLFDLPLWATQRHNEPLPEDPENTQRHLSA